MRLFTLIALVCFSSWASADNQRPFPTSCHDPAILRLKLAFQESFKFEPTSDNQKKITRSFTSIDGNEDIVITIMAAKDSYLVAIENTVEATGVWDLSQCQQNSKNDTIFYTVSFVKKAEGRTYIMDVISGVQASSNMQEWAGKINQHESLPLKVKMENRAE